MVLVQTPKIRCLVFGQASVFSYKNQFVNRTILILDSRKQTPEAGHCPYRRQCALVEYYCNRINSDGGLFAYHDR